MHVRITIKAHYSHPLGGSWRLELEETTCSRFHEIGQVAFTPVSECCSTKCIISPRNPASKSSFYTQQILITAISYMSAYYIWTPFSNVLMIVPPPPTHTERDPDRPWYTLTGSLCAYYNTMSEYCKWTPLTGFQRRLENLENGNDHGKVIEHEKMAKSHGIL